MNSQISAMQFFNGQTGGNEATAKAAHIRYINQVLSTNFGSLEPALEAYYEYSKTNPPTNVAPTQAVVSDQEALVVPVTGTYATTATVTVVDGVVTAIVLS